MQTFALFGSTEKHFKPEGGFCISVFAIIRRGRQILLVRPSPHPKWEEEWSPNWRLYDPERVSRELKSWRFPSAYVREGESPDDALARLMKEQLGITSYRVRSNKLLNFYEPSSRVPGKMHWDYCFVYAVSTKKAPITHPWFAAVQYIDVRRLTRDEFGSAQGDLAKALNLA